MADTFYETFTARNDGYISAELQEKIRATKVLIAGCGIGSTVAEALVRMGVTTIGLADLDHVEPHNLNRQIYIQEDVGQPKVEALAKRLRAINPHLSLTLFPDGILTANAEDIVSRYDFIFDTIDFLQLSSIVALHDAAHVLGKHLVSALSAGWGSMLIYFPPRPDALSSDFRTYFGLPRTGPVEDGTYTEHFKVLIEHIRTHLDPEIARVMAKALTIMEDGKPCPASQISAGSFSVASLATTVFARVLGGKSVAASPELIYLDTNRAAERGAFSLG